MLRQAVEVAEYYLNSNGGLSVIESILKPPNNKFMLIEEMSKVTVQYAQLDKDQPSSTAWTNEKADVYSIFINKIIQARIAKIEPESDEWKTIVLYCAILIVHQLAHLFLRWIGGVKDSPPPTFGNEIGLFFERYIFGYQLCAMVKKEASNSEWTEDSEICGKIFF
jgi:hypothetical protein